MRLTLSRKIFIIFAILTLLSVGLGGGVLVALKNLAALRENIDTVNEFRVQLAYLQAMQREVILQKRILENDRIGNEFIYFQKLAEKIDKLLERRSLENKSVDSTLKQFSYYKQAYLEVFSLYRRDMVFPETNSKIFESLILRVNNLSPEKRVRIHENLTSMIMLQETAHQSRLGTDLRKAKELGQVIMEIAEDGEFAEAIKALIVNVEKNFFNHLAIEDREKFLNNTAENFEQLSVNSLMAIGGDIRRNQKELTAYILVFLLMMPFVTTVLWRFSARYFNNFLDSLGSAVRSIRAGEFDFEVTEVSNDELGDQILFIKELAENIKDKIEKIADSEEKFRGLVENISDWAWSVDENYTCTYSSPRCKKIIGVNSLDIVGENVNVFLRESKESFPEAETFYNIIKKHKSFDDLMHKVKVDDGKDLIIETSGRTIVDDESNFKGFRLLSRDISQLRRSEEKLKKRSLDQLLLNDIMGLALAELEIDEILDRFLEMVLAASWLELEETGAVFLVHEDKKSLVLRVSRGRKEGIEKSCAQVPFGICLCGKAARSGKIVFADTIDDRHEIILEGMHRHGHLCLPIHSVAGEVLGVLCCYLKENSPRNAHVESTLTLATTIIGSIIKRRRAEENLYNLNLDLEDQVEQRTAQLTVANKELDSFAYSVSHDLRAPLRAIDGFSLALFEDYGESLDDDGKNYLDRIRKGCQRMGQQIDDILRLSRLTRGDINRERIDLSPLAIEIVEILQQGEPERKVETIISPSLKVNADPVMTRAVLENLLGNAWKYTAKKSDARIKLSRHNIKERDAFVVEDNGAGFDMKYADKLFVAFQRLHSPEEFEGSGIGLATVQRIVNRHGGRVWADSIEGQGSKFYFYL